MQLRKQFKKAVVSGLAALALSGGSLPSAASPVPAATSRFARTAFNDSAPQMSPRLIAPPLIAQWQDYIKSYPLRRAAYIDAETRLWQSTRPVTLAGGKSMEQLEEKYPFLHDSLESARAVQRQIGTKADASAIPLMAELDGGKSGIRVLFVDISGPLFCGMQGCETSVYIDRGGGWKKALDIIAGSTIYVSEDVGRVSLFPSPYQKGALPPPEWALRGDKFVMRQPPGQYPPSPLYWQWVRAQGKTPLQQPAASVAPAPPRRPSPNVLPMA